MFSRSAQVVVIPLLLALAALVAVAGTWWEQERSASAIHELTRDHVHTAVSLVKEATEVALAIHAEGFADLERRLLAESEILLEPTCTDACLEHADPWFTVSAVEQGGNLILERWGPVATEDRSGLLGEARREEPGIRLLEFGLQSAPSLICALGSRQQRSGVFCTDAATLERRLNQVGPGAILRQVEAHGIKYVAIQDASGILAASPSVETLSAVDQDPFFDGLDWSEADALYFRDTTFKNREVLEGIGQIELPDGSRSLLRVGVDATRLKEVAEQRYARRTRLIAACLIVLLLACLAAGGLYRRQKVHDRLKAEQERVARQEERWRDLSRMAAMTAHEVRNPLSTIRMAAQRIELEYGGEATRPIETEPCSGAARPIETEPGSGAARPIETEPGSGTARPTETEPGSEAARQIEQDPGRGSDGGLAELSSVITTEVDRLDGLVGDFLSLSRPLSIDPRPVSLRELADEAMLSLRMRSERDGQTIEVTGDPRIVASVDRGRMVQLLHNLAGNALDACGSQGHVEIRIGTDNAGKCAFIEVADNGPGLSDEEKAKVLETFYTTKSFGTGLGLPLVIRIAEGHGGAFEFLDRPGGGLTARVSVPLVKSDEVTHGQPADATR